MNTHVISLAYFRPSIVISTKLWYIYIYIYICIYILSRGHNDVSKTRSLINILSWSKCKKSFGIMIFTFDNLDSN